MLHVTTSCMLLHVACAFDSSQVLLEVWWTAECDHVWRAHLQGARHDRWQVGTNLCPVSALVTGFENAAVATVGRDDISLLLSI